MKINDFHTIYFIGIGGIGMSALARYFNAFGKSVLGYDKTPTALTYALIEEGIGIHFYDQGESVLDLMSKEGTLVIYTPAVPADFGELQVLKMAGFTIIKRAKALGLISEAFETFAVAGTHGKTTTTSILAHVLAQTSDGCNAFIGGISTNFNSNCVINEHSKRVVLEADEFDRSFLQLKPNYSIITSIDADHLDIYGDGSQLEESFNEFSNLTNSNGLLIVHDNVVEKLQTSTEAKVVSYASDNGDYQLKNYRFKSGKIYFDVVTKNKRFDKIEFGIPGRHNAENGLAVFALCLELGIDEEVIRTAFASFSGVKRRFEYHIRKDELIMIDDYAHHPTEIKAFLSAVRELYPNKRITAAFQPHLYSRTRDFLDEFAASLSIADEVFMLPIYPARELPIPGIESEVVLAKIKANFKSMTTKEYLARDLHAIDPDIVVVIGAGDIDACVEPIKVALLS